MSKMERAKKAIDEVFSDTSKSKDDTRGDLLDLRAEIEQCLATLDEL